MRPVLLLRIPRKGFWRAWLCPAAMGLLQVAVWAGVSERPARPGALSDSGAVLPSEGPSTVLRIGIAESTWSGVNRNDAAAAITAWAHIILNQRGTSAEVKTTLFRSDNEVAEALRNHAVDAVTMQTDQVLALEPALRPGKVFVALKNSSLGEKYVLVVHRAGGIHGLADFQGRRLVLQKNARTSLALPWLDILLARESLGPAEGVLQSIVPTPSPSKAVLQVFFRQADASLVTSNVFELSCELNPQVGKELQVLALSPEFIPSLFFFCPGDNSKVREELEPAILALHQSAAGRQVLTVFQCDRMVERPISCLESARDLLEEYQHLRREPAAGRRQAALRPELKPFSNANFETLHP